MIDRFKVMSGLMALTALFLVFISFKYLKIDLDVNSNHQKGNLSFALEKDWDNDGLTNKDESYWNSNPDNPDTDGDGYLDGEEVASGHDPLRPAPDDLLENNNLTKKVANLTLGGIVEGSLKPTSPNYSSSINLVLDEILNQSPTNLPLKIHAPKTVEDTPENILKYAVSILIYLESIANEDFDGYMAWVDIMGDVDLSNISTLTENPELFKKSTAFARKQADTTGKQLQILEAFDVPKKFSSDHVEILVFFEKIKRDYELFSDTSKDPVQSLVIFQELATLFTDRLPDLFDTLSKELGNTLRSQQNP